MLAIHGWLDNCESFHFLAPVLAAAGHHVVAVDLPGHGLTDHLPRGLLYHDVDNVLTIHRLVTRRGWSRVSLVGHSMGGGLCQLYAATFPHMVDKLVMIDITHMPRRPITPDNVVERVNKCVQSFQTVSDKEVRVYQTMDECVQRKQRPPFQIPGLEMSSTLTQDAARILCQRGVKSSKNGLELTRDIRLNLPNLERLSVEDHVEIAKHVKCPQLIIEYADFPREQFNDDILTIFKDCNPLLEYHELDGTHHGHLNDPLPTNDLILKFLSVYKSKL